MSLDGGVVLVDPVSGEPYSLGEGTEPIGGVGLLGGVTLVDPETGKAYKADAGGGGAVDSVNGQTGTVVLDAGDVGAPNLVTTPNRVYGTDGSGAEQSYTVAVNATGTSVPLRGADGTVTVGTPTANTHAATKIYVDDNTVAKTSETGSVYATNLNGTPTLLKYSQSGTGQGAQNALAQYSGGSLQSASVNPTSDNYVVNTQMLNQRLPLHNPDLNPGYYVLTADEQDGEWNWWSKSVHLPEPPATGNYRLESVDGVAEWVEV